MNPLVYYFLVLRFTTFTMQSAGTESLRIVAWEFICQIYQASILSTFRIDKINYVGALSTGFGTAPLAVPSGHVVDLSVVRSSGPPL